MRELHRRRHAERREARQILRREQLRVLDPLAQAERAPRVARRARTRRAPRGSRGRRSRAPRPGTPPRPPRRTIAASSSPLVICTPEPSSSQRGLRAERPVHEHLQVAEPQQPAAEPRAQPERAQLGELLVRHRLPDAQRQRAARPRAAATARARRGRRPCRAPPSRPRAAASFSPRRIASTYSSAEARRCRAWKRHADSSRRTPVGSPRASRSTTPPATSRSPPASASAAELSQSEWPSFATIAAGHVARHLVEQLLRRLAAAPVAAAPAAPAQHAARGRARRRGCGRAPRRATRCRRGSPAAARAPSVGKCTCASLKPGQHDAPAEVDDVRRGERGLVDADAARDPLARDRERALRRDLRVERPDEAVLEDHRARESRCCVASARRSERARRVDAARDRDGRAAERAARRAAAIDRPLGLDVAEFVAPTSASEL